MLKLTMSTGIVVVLIGLFVVGIAATTYYYSIPRPTSLRILHTHSEVMVDEIVRAFEEWYQAQPGYGHPIKVTATHTDPETAYEKATAIFRTAEAEIWWGGQLALFEDAYDRLLPYNSTGKDDSDLTHSFSLRDTSKSTPRWYAASLYGLGVMYNEHRLQELNLPVPQTWADLTTHDYKGNITMVDPSESELTLPLIMLVLQHKNWTSGWEYLVTLSALIEEYETDELNSALKVSSDYLPLAIVPDFYAYERMALGLPGLQFTYLDGTILQPDPIAILERGVHLTEAKAFVNYILTPEAQNIIGKYLMPMHQNATVFPSEHNPFDPAFPHIYEYNATLHGIIGDYYRTWIARKLDEIKLAYEEIREANITKDANSNATHYFNLAWKNFTYAGHYQSSIEIENLYNATSNWTEGVAAYIGKWEGSKWVEGQWGIASALAYTSALTNAQKSRQAAEADAPAS